MSSRAWSRPRRCSNVRSARLLAALIGKLAPERGGTWIDARQVITVHQTELGPTVLWEESRQNFRDVVPADFTGIAVMTGFIASDETGLQTTLGRNGSDYSASIFGALLGADQRLRTQHLDGRRRRHECRSEPSARGAGYRPADL